MVTTKTDDPKMRGITNISRKTVLAQKRSICRSIASKARGLMFTNKEAVEEMPLVFEFKRPGIQSLHMLFVFYPIDVVFLDEKKKVLDIKQNFRPFRTYTSMKRSKYVIELPEGVVKRSKTEEGDQLEW